MKLFKNALINTLLLLASLALFAIAAAPLFEIIFGWP